MAQNGLMDVLISKAKGFSSQQRVNENNAKHPNDNAIAPGGQQVRINTNCSSKLMIIQVQHLTRWGPCKVKIP